MLAAPPVPAAELDAERAAAAAELPGRSLLAVRAPWSAAMGRRRVFSLGFQAGAVVLFIHCGWQPSGAANPALFFFT